MSGVETSCQGILVGGEEFPHRPARVGQDGRLPAQKLSVNKRVGGLARGHCGRLAWLAVGGEAAAEHPPCGQFGISMNEHLGSAVELKNSASVTQDDQ